MPDLTPPRAAEPPGLARGVRREVVVVHVALAGLRLDGVEPLGEPEIGERQRAQDLRLAAGEQPRAVDARKYADLGGGRPDLVEGPKVRALAVPEVELPERLLLERVDRVPDLCDLASSSRPSVSSRRRHPRRRGGPAGRSARCASFMRSRYLLAQLGDERVLFLAPRAPAWACRARRPRPRWPRPAVRMTSWATCSASTITSSVTSLAPASTIVMASLVPATTRSRSLSSICS